MGVAYKRDIEDWRESPALKVMDLLKHDGARVNYHDPHVPSFTDEHGEMWHSLPLSQELLERADCVLILTDHRSIDYARKRRSGAVALEDAPELSVDADAGDPLLRARLKALIASLPEAPRMVMILRYQEELMPEEIARVLEMPVRTVKSHLHRSLAMLREKIERSMGEVT